jgi:hypothetical protein
MHVDSGRAMVLRSQISPTMKNDGEGSLMRCRRYIFCILLLPAAALAHHSFVNFDRTQERVLTGTVTRFEWKNPHVYIHVAAKAADGSTQQWQIEAASPSIMRTYDWSAASLKPGDAIQVNYNPARRPDHLEGWLLRARQGDRILAGPSIGSTARDSSAAATSLDGIWVPQTTLSAQAKLRLNPASLPLTPKGRESLASFRENSSDNPASRCVPPVAPTLMVIPEVKQIKVGPRLVEIRSEGFEATRTVHLGEESHDQANASLQGHSIGRWEGGKLVVDTRRFSPNRVGTAIGVASGPGKHLVETFELLPDRRHLRYTFTLSDPEYLTAPVSDEVIYDYRPELKYTQDGCDEENSSRFTRGAG